jgi:hypothetical protein
MENLPKNVINKIMLFLSTPTADIVKHSFIFDFMALRLEKHRRRIRGSAFSCGLTDTWIKHRFFRPRQFTITPEGQRSTKLTLEDGDYNEYVAAYLHSSRVQDIGPRDLYPTWRIKGNRFKWLSMAHPEREEPESGTESDSDSDWEPPSETPSELDSDSDDFDLDSEDSNHRNVRRVR